MHEIFFRIHQGLPREGPGDAASTARAYRLLSDLPARPRVLDVGCGPGSQTIELARLSSGPIVALDTHAAYLDELRGRSRDAGVADRVFPLRASMAAIPLADASVDAIWAEGSVYLLGFERALREWRRLLTRGGSIAATHLSWLTDNPSDEPRAFWARAFPAMTTVAANLAVADACGFDAIDHFTLPESAWWAEYYGPMEARIAQLLDEYRGDAVACAVLEGSREQIDLYRRHADAYGYVFYVLRRREPIA